MSDESEPPALSLRPRKKPDEEKSGEDNAAAAEDAPPKLSLKPKAATDAPAADTGNDSATDDPPKLSLKSKAKAEVPVTAPSAESESPKPRLKPKLSINTNETAAAPDPTAAPEPSAEEPPAKPRLKPKLSVQPAEETVQPIAEEPAPPAAPTEPAAPSSPPPEPPAAAHSDETNPGIDPAVKEALAKAKAEKPRLKLTVSKAADASSPEAPKQSSGFVGDAASPAAPADPSLPPPVPVVTHEDGAPATTPPLPPPAQLADDGDDDDDSEAPARKRLKPEQRPIFKIAVLVAGIVLLGAIGGGGYMIYKLFFASPELNPYAAPLEAVVESSPEPVPADGPASVAGQLVDQAQAAVAAHDEGVEAVDSVSGAADTGANDATPSGVTLEISDSANVPTQAEPSRAFRDWVNNVVISGVAETSNPRAFINSVLVKRGDTVDHGLGIVFDGIDPDENLVLFKDGSGAVMGKRY